MKRSTIIIIILAIFCVSSSVTNTLQTTRPAPPVKVWTSVFNGDRTTEYEVKNFIDENVKKGWIVKSVTISGGDNYSKGLVVLEKY